MIAPEMARAKGQWRVLFLLGAVACAPPQSGEPTGDAATGAEESFMLRVALFNIRELKTSKLAGDDPQARAAGEIVDRIRPDVLVINEIDHDYSSEEAATDLAATARRFAESYLAESYPHAWAAPNNTGFLTGLDLDGDGHVATDADRGERRHGNDCFGWGTYPGEYSMAVLSKLPLDAAGARTFQHFLWRDLPGHHIPPGHYSDAALEILRLSSKSHWDLPLMVGERRLHLLISHPTPPGFDGEEDRNGRRNFDEIKLWAEYLDGSEAIYDDAGRRGGLDDDASFVILGDLNARPGEERSRYDGKAAIDQLLGHPRVQDSGRWVTSAGGAELGVADATAPFGDGVRIDYVLPSVDLEIVDGGVFWPGAGEDPEGAALAETASDHRLVWLDLRLETP